MQCFSTTSFVIQAAPEPSMIFLAVGFHYMSHDEYKQFLPVILSIISCLAVFQLLWIKINKLVKTVSNCHNYCMLISYNVFQK